MPSPPPGIYNGFDEQDIEAVAGYYSKVGTPTFNTGADFRHVDLETGDLSGAASLRIASASLYLSHRGITWQECIIEYWLRFQTQFHFVYIRDDNDDAIHCYFRLNATTLLHQGSVGTLGTAAIENAAGAKSMWSHLWSADYTNGTMITWQDGIEKLRSTTGRTAVNVSSANWGSYVLHFNCADSYIDDLGWRPRTILVDGVGGSKTDTPTAITGTPNATVYAWENDTTDSAGGAGDPNLASDEWRLYLKNLSFEADDPASGWADDGAVTVTGLTASGANILVNAPHAGYSAGMEPGSMLHFNALHVIGTPPDGAGTEDAAGSLQGGATTRLEALQTEGDGKTIRHTAATESVTVNTTNLTAAQEAAITEVIGIQVGVRGLTDGAAPNAFACRVLDNGGSAQVGENHEAVGASNSSRTKLFPTDAGGGQWAATGTGAGTLSSSEVGYTTRTK
jgi:hypothetical protein